MDWRRLKGAKVIVCETESSDSGSCQFPRKVISLITCLLKKLKLNILRQKIRLRDGHIQSSQRTVVISAEIDGQSWMYKLPLPHTLSNLPSPAWDPDSWPEISISPSKIVQMLRGQKVSEFDSIPTLSLYSVDSLGGQDVAVANIMSHVNYRFQATTITEDDVTQPVRLSVPPVPERNVQGIAGRRMLAYMDRQHDTFNFFLGNPSQGIAKWVRIRLGPECPDMFSFSELYVLGIDEVYGRVYVRHHNVRHFPELYILQF
ncbi:hypothetical protein SISSUDRAFT_515861 [Sistotremastrum suecicum HHB10207 ss-3]|uniref:Uncharacterized protein n=1 Tax=Sistotremastrum suecicum HHB10207 ss-3 TaxID=1314776 RepID=A0A166F851_9AGAM|nr:hypothetical protein SISSUDRAFT_515861 [Sistotremastrum suecicum HHB10207 ss-3]